MKRLLLLVSIAMMCHGAATAATEIATFEDLGKVTTFEAPPGTVLACRGAHCRVNVHVVSTGPIQGPNNGHYVCRTFLDYHKIVVSDPGSEVVWTLRKTQKTDDAEYRFIEIKPGDLFGSPLSLHGIQLDSAQDEFIDGRLDGRRYRWKAAKGRGTEIGYFIMVAQFRKGVVQGYCEPNDPIIVNQS